MSFRNLCTRAKAVLLLACIYTLPSYFNKSFAQTPIAPTIWSGSPASAAGPSAFTTLPATVTPGAATVNISQWDRNVVTFNAAAACYNTTNWEVGGTMASAVASNKYIYFKVTNSATVELQITRLFIRSQVSATGPQSVQVQYSIGTVTNNFGPLIATAHTASPEDWNLLDNVCVGPGETATFKLYGWGGTTSAGTLRINDGTIIIAGFATPVTGTASSTSPVCAGTPLSFTGTASGGIPGYTYSWAGPGGFTSTLLSPSISSPTPVASGVYTLTITDVLSCTSSSTPVTTTVTVNSAPAPITGTTIVCPGLTTTLSSTTAGGTWSSSDISIATVGSLSGVVTGVNAGTATITYMLSSLCVATTTVTVDVPPAPISGSLSLCQGTSTTLSSTTTPGTWASSDISIATIGLSTGVLNGIAVGTATITYTISTGCYTTATVTVYPFPAAITGTAVVCEGSSTTLSNTSAGGTWSSSDLSVATLSSPLTGTVNGISAGTAIITYMLGGGCSSTSVVTVNPLPDVISGTTVVCAGSVQMLTNTFPGGTWSSSDITVATIGSSAGNMFGVAAGTATITYMLGTGCYTTATITVNPIPAPITGPTGVCLGATVTLNNATPGGSWSSSNTVNAPIDASTGIVTGAAVGTATISYILSATGCFVTRVETVNPLPAAITGPGVVCPGLTVTLSSSPAGGAWTSGNITIATVAAGTGVVTGVSAGVVNITYTLPTTCRTSRAMTVNPQPPATITPIGDTTFCPGDFVVLSANTGTGLTYQWFQGAASIPGAIGATYIASTTGNYRVRVTNGLGCPTMSAPMAVLVNSVTATITVPGGSLVECAVPGVTLNATAGVGYSYQWMLGGAPIAGATGMSYTAVLTGNYTVQIINITGCSDVSAPVSVTILPSPSTTVTLSGPLSFCQGGNVVITGAAGTGYTYQWHNTSGAIPGATNISYTGSVSGSYWVDITNTFGCTVSSLISNVVVNPLPVVGITLGGPKVFCSGGSVALTAIAGAYSYQWYKGGVAIAGATGNSYTANTGGGYRVRVTDLATGCTDITHADTVVTLVTMPVVLPLTPTKFCWGGSSLLSTSLSSVGFAVNYQWYLNGVAIPGAISNTYAAGVAGNYSCDIIVPGSCSLTTASVAVTEVPLPNPIITKTGSTLRTANYFVTFQWYKNLIPIAGATYNSILHTGNGNYKVRVTDTNGCQSVSDTYVLTGSNGSATNVGIISKDETVIYPNPTDGVVHIESNIVVRAVVSGMDGRVLIDRENAETIDISSFATGVYLLVLYNDNNIVVKTEKLVKHSR